MCINSFGLQSAASFPFPWGPRSRETENLPKAMRVEEGRTAARASSTRTWVLTTALWRPPGTGTRLGTIRHNQSLRTLGHFCIVTMKWFLDFPV